MLKLGQKNNYQKFLNMKRKFAAKIKRGQIFKDTDHDGLCDYEEKNIYGTDPNNPDTDGDGMKDGAEVKRGRNPLGPGKLKDLFIPHAGNDYLPHALKPERLLFHAISIVAMKAVVVIFIIFYPLSAWLSPDVALAEVRKIIELTNNLRQKISLPGLTESRQLKQAAWEKVQDMAFKQYFAHTGPTGFGLRYWLEKISYKYTVAGENLAVGFSRAEDVVEAWKNSPTHYANMVDRDFKEIGVAVADGKLNQIETAFIAQYFAAPVLVKPAVKETVKKPAAAPVAVVTPPANDQPTPDSEVRGISIVKATSTAETAPATVAADDNKITIDQQTADLSIKSDQSDQVKIIQIETTLPADTVSAEVIVNSKKIPLYEEPNETGEWSGAAIINQDEEKSLLNPLIPATIAVNNAAGATKYGELDWDKVNVIKASPYEQYRMFKSSPTVAMARIMDLSNFYFKFILLIAVIALFLNIFIEIKRQHPRIIFYNLSFILLLSAMLAF